MFKKLLLIFILGISLFANDSTNKNNSSFLDDLMGEFNSVADSNLTDSLKFENMQNYIANLKFNDKIDKTKYKLNLMGHYENYMLLGGHSSSTLTEKHWKADGTRDTTRDYSRDSNEAQFQLSIKTPLYSNFLSTKADPFAAYTQNAYWQVYDTAHSSPFRETNYMPELFLEWQPNKKLGDSYLKQVRFALIHQSNGQDIGQSRSWNRTEMFFLLQNQNIYYGMNIWDRWNEDAKVSPSATAGDDNVGLEDYVGNQRFFVKYKVFGKKTYFFNG